jgi:DNA-binding MarR family transcriptional regulator
MAQPMPPDRRAQSWALVVHDTARLIRRRFDVAIRDLGLTQAKWRVLATLSRHPGLRQSELAERLDIEKAPLGLALEWLEQAGWIRRESDPQDRRARRVYLSEQSAPTLALMEERFRGVETQYLRGFDESEVAGLLDSLQALRETLREGDPAPERPDTGPETYLSVLFACSRILIRRFDARLAELGFNRAQWMLLNTIDQHEGLRQTTLADLTELGNATIGRTIDGLERNGWVERRVDPTDRRANRLHLSRRGRAMLASTRERFETLHGNLERALGPERHANLLKRLGWIRQRLLEEAAHTAEARRAGVRA